MKDNTVLIYAVTLIGITLLSYILWNIDYSERLTEEPVFINNNFCGTVGFGSTPLGKEGRSLFKTNCAACHSLYKRRTGPALFGTLKKFPSDSVFLTYIRGQKKVLDTLSHNSPGVNQFPNMSYKEASALKTYIDMF